MLGPEAAKARHTFEGFAIGFETATREALEGARGELGARTAETCAQRKSSRMF
jgi:hypothetical protein